MSDQKGDGSIDTNVLATTPTDWRASIIAGILREHDIRVETEGELTSAFGAEAPGEVRVIVREDEYEQAKELVEQAYEQGRLESREEEE